MNFCVYLTIYKGNKLPPFYIGSSSVLKIQKGYCGSVNSKKFVDVWRHEIKINRSNFCVKIIKTFNGRQEAYEYEDKLHRQLNVIHNQLYVNASFASNAFSAIMTDETKRKIARSKTGKIIGPHSELTKAKISAASKGKKKSLEHRQAIIVALTGRVRSESAKRKTAAANTGKIRSKESRDRISAALIGKKRDSLTIGNDAYFKKLKNDGMIYIITDNNSHKYKTSNLEKFCDSIGAYQTSFARSLKSKKPLLFGKFKGWQVLEKISVSAEEFKVVVLQEMNQGFGINYNERH